MGDDGFMHTTRLQNLKATYVVAVRTVGVATFLAVTISAVRANYVFSMDWGWMR